MDFSQGAGASSPSSLIPKGQLAWAILTVRGIKSSASGGQYLDCELTIDDNQPFARKKLWDMIGDPNHAGNSEAYRQMGLIAITRILESGRGAGPNNPAGYKIDNYQQLSGLRVAIKIGVEKGTDGYDDKNRVADYLTPNPASKDGHKPFLDLQAGKFSPGGSPPASTGQSGFGFGGNAGGGAPANTGGFGNAGGGAAPASGFQQPQRGQGAASAAGQQQQTGFAGTTNATGQSPSNDPAATPSWLSQAGAQ